MIVAVITGSRRRSPTKAQLAAALDGADMVIVGDADGVDNSAVRYALTIMRLPTKRVRIHYAEDHGDWPECGPERNRAIVKEAKRYMDIGATIRATGLPCVDSRGTWGAIKELAAVGIEAKVVKL